MKLPHHLYQHPDSGIYYFRLSVPLKLRPCMGKQQIRQSLHTKDPALAKKWAYVLSARFLADFHEKQPMTHPKLADVLRAAQQAKKYEVVLPSGLTIRADDAEDHYRALETITRLDDMGAFASAPPAVTSKTGDWHPAKPLKLSEASRGTYWP